MADAEDNGLIVVYTKPRKKKGAPVARLFGRYITVGAWAGNSEDAYVQVLFEQVLKDEYMLYCRVRNWTGYPMYCRGIDSPEKFFLALERCRAEVESGAFELVSRDCAERVVEHYPEFGRRCLAVLNTAPPAATA